jgi:serine/threonine-protein kinase
MYLAPEELRGEPLTKAVDQYHLALIAHKMPTGGLPWTNEGTNELIFRKLAGGHHPVAEDAQRLGSGRIAALRRALDEDPLKRFDTCGEFIRALK